MVGASREVVGDNLRTECWEHIKKNLLLYANEYELYHLIIGDPLKYFLKFIILKLAIKQIGKKSYSYFILFSYVYQCPRNLLFLKFKKRKTIK